MVGFCEIPRVSYFGNTILVVNKRKKCFGNSAPCNITTWMDFQGIMLSEMKLKIKKNYIISLISKKAKLVRHKVYS